MDLQAYLERRSAKDNSKVLAPVWVKVKNGKPIKSKRCPYILELPSSVDLQGMTSEFDSMLVQENRDGSIKIHEVWEAKSSLYPITLEDILKKKYGAIREIYKQDSIELFFNDTRHNVDTSEGIPPLGIFGTVLVEPKSAARRTVIACGETLLESDPDKVREALRDGSIQVPKEVVNAKLALLLEQIRKSKPILALSSEKLGNEP